VTASDSNGCTIFTGGQLQVTPSITIQVQQGFVMQRTGIAGRSGWADDYGYFIKRSLKVELDQQR